MTLVAHLDLELHRMDMKTMFLNGNIIDTIYMVQLENFITNNSKSMVSHSAPSTCLFGPRHGVKPTDIAHFKNDTSWPLILTHKTMNNNGN